MIFFKEKQSALVKTKISLGMTWPNMQHGYATYNSEIKRVKKWSDLPCTKAFKNRMITLFAVVHWNCDVSLPVPLYSFLQWELFLYQATLDEFSTAILLAYLLPL